MKNKPSQWDTIPIVRIEGLTPKSKNAVREALNSVPQFVQFHADQVNGERKITVATEIKPLEPFPFTDGQGKYYGTVIRSVDGKTFLVD